MWQVINGISRALRDRLVHLGGGGRGATPTARTKWVPLFLGSPSAHPLLTSSDRGIHCIRKVETHGMEGFTQHFASG